MCTIERFLVQGFFFTGNSGNPKILVMAGHKDCEFRTAELDLYENSIVLNKKRDLNDLTGIDHNLLQAKFYLMKGGFDKQYLLMILRKNSEEIC